MVVFDKFYYPVVLYANYLMCLFMNIYANLKNDVNKISNGQELEPCGRLDLPFIPMTIPYECQIVHWEPQMQNNVLKKLSNFGEVKLHGFNGNP